MQNRNRACAAVLDSTNSRILMVRHGDAGSANWTLPCCGLKEHESFRDAAIREVYEDAGIEIDVVEPIFDRAYTHDGVLAVSRCFYATQRADSAPKLPRGVAWRELRENRNDKQIQDVLEYLEHRKKDLLFSNSRSTVDDKMSIRFFRVHSRDMTATTRRPRGLFVAVWKLVESKTLTPEETDEYWQNRKWFEEILPVPGFYADGNSVRAVTWYKNNIVGNEMFGKMRFYRDVARKYGLELYRTCTAKIPGKVIYEDDCQIGVVNSLHSGEGFVEEKIT